MRIRRSVVLVWKVENIICVILNKHLLVNLFIIFTYYSIRMSAIRYKVLSDRAFPLVCYRTLVECKGSGFLGISVMIWLWKCISHPYIWSVERYSVFFDTKMRKYAIKMLQKYFILEIKSDIHLKRLINGKH